MRYYITDPDWLVRGFPFEANTLAAAMVKTIGTAAVTVEGVTGLRHSTVRAQLRVVGAQEKHGLLPSSILVGRDDLDVVQFVMTHVFESRDTRGLGRMVCLESLELRDSPGKPLLFGHEQLDVGVAWVLPVGVAASLLHVPEGSLCAGSRLPMLGWTAVIPGHTLG